MAGPALMRGHGGSPLADFLDRRGVKTRHLLAWTAWL